MTTIAAAATGVGVVLLLAGGCGSGAPPQPAHSPSFFPVRGTADSGIAVDTLHWNYRINRGELVALGSLPNLGVRYSDQAVSIFNTTLRRLLNGTVSALDGSNTVSGMVLSSTVDQLDRGTPASILKREVSTNTSLTIGSDMSMTNLALEYGFGTPLSTLFDREDLDQLEVGLTTSGITASASVTGNVKVTNTSGGEPVTSEQRVVDTVTLTLSWTLAEVLPTFVVLGRTYTNVVRVTTTTSAAATSDANSTTQTESMIWLAKGVGVIRQEDTVQQTTGANQTLAELIDTNLAGP
jgi:hypothetical protein